MALAAEELEFAYHAARPVLRGVSAVIEPGTITAVLGPNGSGKTTFLRLLLGLRRPDRGVVTLDGAPLSRLPAKTRAARLAYVAQRPSTAFSFSLRETAAMGRHAFGGRAPVDEALERVGLLDLADAPFGELSVGQQQLGAVARALAQVSPAGEGKYLLADEPLSALDPSHALTVQSLLRSTTAAGVGVGVVVHDVGAAVRLADRVILLDDEGRVAAAGDAAATCTPEVLEGVFGVRFERAGAMVFPAPAQADSIQS